MSPRVSPSGREPASLDGVPIENATYSATQETDEIVNSGFTGIRIYLDVTGASGTGGLKVVVRETDPLSEVDSNLNVPPTAITVTGHFVYVVAPGAGSANASLNVKQVTPQTLPRRFKIQVLHLDGTDYDYSLGYTLTK